MSRLLKAVVLKIPKVKRLWDQLEFYKAENAKLLESSLVTNNGNLKLMEEINFLKFRLDEMAQLHDDVVLRYWINSENRKKYACNSPFDRIEVLPDGEVYTCCSAHLKHGYSLGNIYHNTIEETWNSEHAKKLRYSVTKGDFEYCNHLCRWLHSELDEDISPLYLRNDKNFDYVNYEMCTLDTFPKQIALSCDETCNLTCPSCRTEIKSLDDQQSEKLYQCLVDKILPILPYCDHLSALGSGEFFASIALKKFYQNLNYSHYPNLKLLIITNAQLFTPSVWTQYKNIQDFQIDVVISVDAAQKETYEKIRRSANWERLINNLTFISQLRNEHKIHRLSFNFLIQANNYLEIEAFVQFARQWNVDLIEFQRMANWGSYSDEEFAENNMFSTEENFNKISATLANVVQQTTDIKIIQNFV